MEFELPAPDVVDVADPQAVSGVRESGTPYQASAPTTIITGKVNEDGSFEMRTDAIARDKPDTDGTPGKLNAWDGKTSCCCITCLTFSTLPSRCGWSRSTHQAGYVPKAPTGTVKPVPVKFWVSFAVR